MTDEQEAIRQRWPEYKWRFATTFDIERQAHLWRLDCILHLPGEIGKTYSTPRGNWLYVVGEGEPNYMRAAEMLAARMAAMPPPLTLA